MNLNIASYNNIVVLTGAGISVASGLPTYRGENGVWNRESPLKVATAKAMREKPNDVWQFFIGMKLKAQAAEPNAAHFALAAAERKATGAFTVITQNVDGLHQQAGSSNVLELHGSVHRNRCTACEEPPFEDASAPDSPPPCPSCGAPLRADIVLFEESLPARPEHLSKRALRDCDLFIAIGTSGNVFPAANFVRSARFANATTILVNLDAETQESQFEQVYRKRAEEFLPTLLGVG
jgi:NAD-dependent deacetylase